MKNNIHLKLCSLHLAPADKRFNKTGSYAN